MSGKSKSHYLTVTSKQDPIKAVFKQTFFDKGSLNKKINSPEFQEKYPKTEYYIITEVY